MKKEITAVINGQSQKETIDVPYYYHIKYNNESEDFGAIIGKEALEITFAAPTLPEIFLVDNSDWNLQAEALFPGNKITKEKFMQAFNRAVNEIRQRIE